MTKIELYYDKVFSDFSSVTAEVNDAPVRCVIYPDRVTIDADLDFGLHMLKIKLPLGQQKIKFIDARVNSSSLRMALYMSWQLEGNGQRRQPQTAIWQTDQTWYLPFATPVSHWLSLVHAKIANGDFGKNLSEKYHIRWPGKIALDQRYPAVLRDFFQHDFDFFCINKDRGYRSVPWLPAQINIDPAVKQGAVDDIQAAKNALFDLRYQIGQDAYNLEEFDLWRDGHKWWQVQFKDRGQELVPRKLCPRVWHMIDSLELESVWRIALGVLPPGLFIAPHQDDYGRLETYTGLSLLYIPLQWNTGNYFKFVGTDIVSSADPILINQTGHTHALVNTSDQERIIISCTIDMSQNQRLVPCL